MSGECFLGAKHSRLGEFTCVCLCVHVFAYAVCARAFPMLGACSRRCLWLVHCMFWVDCLDALPISSAYLGVYYCEWCFMYLSDFRWIQYPFFLACALHFGGTPAGIQLRSFLGRLEEGLKGFVCIDSFFSCVWFPVSLNIVSCALGINFLGHNPG